MKKQQLINQILESMSRWIPEQALARLEKVLIVSFHGIQMSEEKTSIIPMESQWQNILRIWIASKKLENCSKGTLENYHRCIRMMMEEINKPIKEITTNDLRFYLAIYQDRRNVKPSYLETMRHTISSWFTWLNDEGYIDRNPARKLKRIKFPSEIQKPFSPSEIEALKRNAFQQRDLALVEFLCSTGARIGEALSLDIDQINFDSKDAIIYGEKGKKERFVYLTDSCCYHLKKYLQSRTDKNPALFVGMKYPHQRLTKSGAQSMLRNLGKKVGIAKVHPHRFRRTLATNALDRGVPIEQVQEILGHAKIETTRIYCTVSESNVRSSFRRLIA